MFFTVVGIHDLIQTRHSILRNYPVIGHWRFFLEYIRPEMRQYFFESDTMPFPFRVSNVPSFMRAQKRNSTSGLLAPSLMPTRQVMNGSITPSTRHPLPHMIFA